MQRLPRLSIVTLPEHAHFIPALARGLAASGMVEIRVFTVRGPSDLPAALVWTDQPERDAIWFEFCWPPFPALIEATNFGGRRVIVRVHRIEAYETDHVARAAWGKVDDLIVVSEDMARCVREVRPGIDELTKLRVIHNGVDADAYPPREQFDPFRVGWCGNFIPRKNPTLALQILHTLRRDEPRYRLHLAIHAADRLTMEAFCHQAAILRLADAIDFAGRLPAASMPAWHIGNGVLLSTSLHESFGFAIAEAAAAGCDLAVLDHLGAAEFWPDAVRFVGIDDAARLIRAVAPDRWRRYVAQSFPLERQVTAVLDLLAAPRVERPPAWDSRAARDWDRRYLSGGDSGAGSGGRLAAFKAQQLNRLVSEYGVRSVLELGCGDGRQLALATYPSYVGLDVSSAAIARCRALFADDADKRFLLAGKGEPPDADLAISLDVVFHLVEDDAFEAHMRCLFARALHLVAIYASDRDEATASPHVRHRAISVWVERHAPNWERIAYVPNPYPHDPARPGDTSFADLHVFGRRDRAVQQLNSASTAEASSRM